MNAMKNKIKSRDGASITFALLIFMVCAVISSVVIVAGTTAAGRMSKVAVTDQRYYAVTSAAGLLRDTIDQKRATVTYDKIPTGANSYDIQMLPTITLEDISDPEHIALYSNDILEKASALLVEKIAKGTADSAASDLTLNLKENAGGVVGNAGGESGSVSYSIACSIDEYVKKDGHLVFLIKNTPPDNAKDKSIYTLQITFTANISSSETLYKKTDAVGNTTTKTVVTTIVDWKFSGIKKGL